MNYFHVLPEIAGESDIRMHDADYVAELDWWPEDEFVTVGTSVLCSEDIAKAIEKAQLTGVKFHKVVIEVGNQFHLSANAHGEAKLPTFMFMELSDKVLEQDIAKRVDGKSTQPLLISEKALETITAFKTANLKLTPYVEGKDPTKPGQDWILKHFGQS